MSNFVRMFQPRFRDLVANGSKTQTIRKTPKRMPKQGDTISCRVWAGRPYRSPQKEILEAQISRVRTIEISESGFKILPIESDSTVLCSWDHFGADQFAKSDGFVDSADMKNWFMENHSIPFEGILIEWQNLTE